MITGELGLSTMRPTMVFSESTTCAAAFTGSMVSCGIAAWPPRPFTTTRQDCVDAEE